MQWWRKEVQRETSSQLYDTEKWPKKEEDCTRRHNTVQRKTKWWKLEKKMKNKCPRDYFRFFFLKKCSVENVHTKWYIDKPFFSHNAATPQNLNGLC